MPRFALLLTAIFLSGGSIMLLEILTVRMFAPFLGNSITVLTSILATVMGGLSIGYYSGGIIADRIKNHVTLLIWIFIFGSFFAVIIALFQESIIIFSIGIPSLVFGSLLASILLLGPVNILLGMVTPIAVKIVHETRGHVGNAAGSVYAISTVGSIAGTVIGGFILIPYFGITTLTFTCGAILAFNALVLTFLVKESSVQQITTLTVLFATCLGTVTAQEIDELLTNNLDSIIADFNTPYHRVRVWETSLPEGDVRVFSDWQSAIYLDPEKSDELVIPYMRAFRLAEHFYPNFKKTLLIGGATYSFPRFFQKKFPDRYIDVVEIDPKLLEISKKYFDFQPSANFRNFTEDGRIFLNRTKEKYDVIYMDAFTKISVIPFQLATQEAFLKAYDALTENGILVMNAVGTTQGESARLIQAEIKTLQSVFPQVSAFPLVDYQSNVSNIILVASKSRRNLPASNSDPLINQLLALEKQVPLPSSTPLLVDNFAPVEHLGKTALMKGYSHNN